MNQRDLLPYEKNHLLRYGFDPEQISDYDQMPVEYITGWAVFKQREFQVSPATLIPRVETEELVDLVVANALNESVAGADSALFRLADIGTGSGAIGITLALELAQRGQPYHVYLSDISQDALQLAKQNAARLAPQLPLSFIESDVFANYPTDARFDVIVANLPYIPVEQLTTLDPSVREYEPWLALDGGERGVEIIHACLTQAKSRLHPTGQIWLEIDSSHTPELLDQDGTFQVEIIADSYGRSRFACLTFR